MKLLDNIPYRFNNSYSGPYVQRTNITSVQALSEYSSFKLKKNSEYVPLGSVNKVWVPSNLRSSAYSLAVKIHSNSYIVRYLLNCNPTDYTTKLINEEGKVNTEYLTDRINKFITDVIGISEPTSRSRGYARINSKAFYAALFNVIIPRISKFKINDKEIMVSSGVIANINKDDLLINDAFGVQKCFNYSDALNRANVNVIAAFMIPRKEYISTRIKMLQEVPDIDIEPNNIKFFVSPDIFKRGTTYYKVGSFLTKHIFPLLEKAGVEVIYESPNKFYNTALGSGYSVENIKKLFIKDSKKIFNETISNSPISGGTLELIYEVIT